MADGELYIDHPNRRKASSKATRAVVILLLLLSVLLILVITIGGWDRLLGAKYIQIAYMLVYIVMAIQVVRWSRGVLPMVAALAMILGIFAGISGPYWLERDKGGFSPPLLDSGLLGLISLILVPVQLLLIAFTMRGFQQAWNVEEEVRPGQERDLGDDDARGGRRRGERAGARLAKA